MYLLYLLFIVLFIVYAGPCMEASKEAVSVFLFSVLPSLLPFFIVSKLLLDSPFTGKMSRLMGSVMEPVFGVPGAGAAALVPGILCGYPVGAAACADLYGLGLLEKAEAERLSAFSSNAGPFFVVGAVGAAMGRSPGAGVVLLATHIAAGLTVGFFFRYYKASARNFSRSKKNKASTRPTSNARKPKAGRTQVPSKKEAAFGRKLATAVSKSVKDVLSVGGFIVIFAIIIAILRKTGIPAKVGQLLMGSNYEIAEGVICGIVEITSGCSILTKSAHSILKLMPYLAFVLGFGGLSVHAQVISILNSAKLRSLPFIMGKILQGIIAAFFTAVVTAIPSVKNYILNTAKTSQVSSTLIPGQSIFSIFPSGIIVNLLALSAAIILIRFTLRYLRFTCREYRECWLP